MPTQHGSLPSRQASQTTGRKSRALHTTRSARYPFVLGGDLAGEIVEVGKGVTRFRIGDRVLGHALGMDGERNRSSEGAFQQYTVIRDNMAASIPESLSYENACVLPLTLSTAATGLFQKDCLALKYPSVPPKPNGEALLVWARSSSVGSNAIQLATAAGYEVFTTASPKNFAYVERLGASQVFDYRSPTIIRDIILALKDKTLAGVLAIGNSGAESCIAVLEKCKGRKFVAMASFPWPETLPEGSGQTLAIISLMFSVVRWQILMWLKSKIKGIPTKFFIGETLQNNEVSHVVYENFLPQALTEGTYVTAPEPFVVGHGLEYIQEAFDVQKKGVSAKKVVVTL
ncbi:hypothetical protein HO133_010375 [Letharia lupina]|uniref:Enoyl reductase (ER) domain-containing protein n=1 Tax=Letharia lupina TaxID=560253 RepID=A0A8H6CKF7_9LECA|nr:uncharacterized protein HO133_010375 [Letharia lupina]KAF6225178.1 hypothetical protein HO133_010375 [Letharia lupina]